MPLYDYAAQDRNGRIERGSMEALNPDELIGSLQRQGYLVLSLSEKRQIESASKSSGRLHHRVKLDDLLMFARQLAILLESGIALLKSLEILGRQVESKKLVLTIEQVRKDIQSGATFKAALAAHPHIFSPFWVNLVETGETSGHLPLALNQVANYLEATGNFQRKVVTALIYPSVLILVATVAILIFVTRIVPIFAGIFEGFDAELPWLTQAVITVSAMVRKMFFFGICACLLLGYIAHRIWRTEWGRTFFDQWKLRLPLFGPVFRMAAVQRFSQGLGTLLESGVPILNALDITERCVGNRVLEEQLQVVKESVRRGEPMATPMEKSGVFPPMVVQMVMVGEEVGELSKMLHRISVFYDQRLDTYVTRLTSLFEPVVLVVMGGVVGVIVVAMFLPIFSLSQVIK